MCVAADLDLTLKAKHLLLLLHKEEQVIVLGIEIYVYLTIKGANATRQIFVLKADTTGLSAVRVSVAAVASEFLKCLLELNPFDYLHGASLKRTKNEKDTKSAHISEFDTVNDLRDISQRVATDPEFFAFVKLYSNRGSQAHQTLELPIPSPTQEQTKISLFTRAADAYLFPNSQKNSGKHVASGNGLFSWWLKVLSNTLDESWLCKADLPGADSHAVKKFFPNDQWCIGNIFVTEEGDELALATVPLFPDDPKGRFLEHLIVENRASGMSTRLFWEELGYRQEFRLGTVVGMIGCVRETRPIVRALENAKPTKIRLKEYKNFREFFRGEDYEKREDVQALWAQSLKELDKRLKTGISWNVLTGTLERVSVTSLANVALTKINNLSGLVKRKRLK